MTPPIWDCPGCLGVNEKPWFQCSQVAVMVVVSVMVMTVVAVVAVVVSVMVMLPGFMLVVSVIVILPPLAMLKPASFPQGGDQG